MPWPSRIIRHFESIPAGGLAGATDESVLYGPINMLLFHLFPEDDYVISPQWRDPPSRKSIDFTTVFIVESAQHTVFFCEVKPANFISTRSSRASADDQMRARFLEFADALKIPTLHGISVVGPHLAFYAYSKAEDVTLPLPIDKHPHHVGDSAPAKQWDTELMSDEGVQRLTAVANQVKEMVNTHLKQFS